MRELTVGGPMSQREWDEARRRLVAAVEAAVAGQDVGAAALMALQVWQHYALTLDEGEFRSCQVGTRVRYESRV